MTSLESTTLINRYFLRRLIGEGGSSEVYQAWDRNRQQNVAIKLFRLADEDDVRQVEILKREADLLHKLPHENIVRLLEAVCREDMFFLVMDWIDGTNLRQMIKERKRPFSPQEATAILQPVCNALNFAHLNGVYHCDIKPANILLNRLGRVFLSDFGVARLSSEKRGGGTPAYMAPEQILGEAVGTYTDIYALGVTMYEMFSGGVLPYRGDSTQSKGSTPRERVEWEHCHLPLPNLNQFNPHLERPVVMLVEKAMSKQPHQRYESTLDLWEEFSLAQSKRDRDYSTDLNIIERTTDQLTSLKRSGTSTSITITPKLQIGTRPVGPYLVGLTGKWAGQVIPISQTELKIGRRDENELAIKDPAVSRRHATILRGRRGLYLRDENSKWGTSVNGLPVQGVVQLKNGDRIMIAGAYEFEFRSR